MSRDSLKTAMLDSLRMNRSVLSVIAAYIICALILARIVGFEITLNLYSVMWLGVCLASFWVWLIIVVVVQLYRHRPASPLKFTWDLLINDRRILERGIVALPCILVFPIFSSAFTSVKSAIEVMHPYRLDPLFAELDSLLHGGHAWELIHPILGYPLVTLVVNFSYNLWFFFTWVVFALATVLANNRDLREQYLLAFVGCWILLGSVGAVAFSSVGPCFYGLLYGTDPYEPLMSYLRSVSETYPVWALSTQDMLWEKHVSDSAALGSGISAMPSMHVAIATLNAIMLSRLSRVAGILGWAYMVMIMLGSVHLAWHYAVDGYVSVVVVLLIWWAAGWWVARSTTPAPVALASS